MTKTKDRSTLPTMLLSEAIMEYQQNKEGVETLESCPPDNMIVIDDGTNVTSATLTDRLQAWAGDYLMWRNDNNQIFLVFTNEELRNSALTIASKFGGRKANKSDSYAANAAKKAKAAQKKTQQKKQRQQQIEQQKSKQMTNSNKRGSKQDGWKTATHTNGVSDHKFVAQNNIFEGINLKNRFG